MVAIISSIFIMMHHALSQKIFFCSFRRVIWLLTHCLKLLGFFTFIFNKEIWNTSKVSIVVYVLSHDRWMWYLVHRIQLLHRCYTIVLISTACFATTVRIQVMQGNMQYLCCTKVANSDVDCWNTTCCDSCIVKRVQKFLNLPEYNYCISSWQ